MCVSRVPWLLRSYLITATFSGLILGQTAKEIFYNASQPAAAEKADGKNASSTKSTHRSSGLMSWIEFDGKRVSTRHVFYSGDRIKLHVESNISGHLTIIQSEGLESPALLFPQSGKSVVSDLVEAGKDTAIGFKFDETPGRIHLFLILRPAASSIQSPASPGTVASLLASAADPSHSKGLKIDVDESSSQPAIYAVRERSNPDSGKDVAVDFVLDHQSRSRNQ
jgi:hypothetical protein